MGFCLGLCVILKSSQHHGPLHGQIVPFWGAAKIYQCQEGPRIFAGSGYFWKRREEFKEECSHSFSLSSSFLSPLPLLLFHYAPPLSLSFLSVHVSCSLSIYFLLYSSSHIAWLPLSHPPPLRTHASWGILIGWSFKGSSVGEWVAVWLEGVRQTAQSLCAQMPELSVQENIWSGLPHFFSPLSTVITMIL